MHVIMHREEGSPEVMHYYLFNCSMTPNNLLVESARTEIVLLPRVWLLTCGI